MGFSTELNLFTGYDNFDYYNSSYTNTSLYNQNDLNIFDTTTLSNNIDQISSMDYYLNYSGFNYNPFLDNSGDAFSIPDFETFKIPEFESYNQNNTNTSKGCEQSYFNAIGARESSCNYQAENQFGYLGKYQFGGGALQDSGYKDKNGNWTGKDGVYSKNDFLNNQQAQENAMKTYTERQWKTLKSLGADKYLGQNMNGITITKSGLLAAAHLGGAGNVMDFLKSGGQDVFKDGNQTPITEYMQKFGGYELNSLA